MEQIKFIETKTKSQIRETALLAKEIWEDYYYKMVGKEQTDYMITSFQSKDAIAKQIEKEGYEYYLVKDSKNKNIGYFAVINKNPELFLSKLYLKAETRGKGFGKKIISFIENTAQNKGLKEISLTVNKNNKNSIEAYKKFGFKIISPILKDIGSGFFMDDYLMKKEIMPQK